METHPSGAPPLQPSQLSHRDQSSLRDSSRDRYLQDYAKNMILAQMQNE